MSISRADLDAGLVDFSDLGTGERLPPVHPGEVLLLEYLQLCGITPYRLAQDIEVPQTASPRSWRAAGASAPTRPFASVGTSAPTGSSG